MSDSEKVVQPERLGPLYKRPLYLQAETRIEELLVRGRYRIGDRIPPEAELMESLDVSRATVRAAVTQLVTRGMLERRQGSGTFVAQLPEGSRLHKGLERLETYTVQADRLGLVLDNRDLCIEAVGADSSEARALEISEGSPLVKVSRVLLVADEPAAWIVDVVPEEVIPADRVREHFPPDAMLLDFLVSEGVPVSFSELIIDAETIGPDDAVGKTLDLSSPSAVFSLTETMYVAENRPVQWSRNIFLPRYLDLRIVRELFEVRKLH
ncbi:MAG: GntR family transcriptional regulator [Rubrobacteraceae bacterium]